MSFIGFLIVGIMILIAGFGIVISISDNDDRVLAAVAFIVGAIGSAFICASGG